MADRIGTIIESTRRRLPVEAQELAWLASGAGLSAFDLWVYNLRGDIGRDGIGCSDAVIASDGNVVMGHNEDGGADLAADVRLITLDIEGDPVVTVIWYPGMLPANSFVTTSAGLSFGMDHVPVVTPKTDGCGRHFVARHAQRQNDGAHARRVLEGIPCVGGFSFDIADANARRADIIENAAGRVRAVPATERALCHTNHLRFVDGFSPELRVPDADPWMQESRDRRRHLSAALQQTPENDASSVLGALRAPGVVNRRPGLWTLATTVVDARADTITVQGSGQPWSGRLSAFALGRMESVTEEEGTDASA